MFFCLSFANPSVAALLLYGCCGWRGGEGHPLIALNPPVLGKTSVICLCWEKSSMYKFACGIKYFEWFLWISISILIIIRFFLRSSIYVKNSIKPYTNSPFIPSLRASVKYQAVVYINVQYFQTEVSGEPRSSQLVWFYFLSPFTYNDFHFLPSGEIQKYRSTTWSTLRFIHRHRGFITL